MPKRVVPVLALMLVTASACSSSGSTKAAAGPKTLHIVAGENFWGSIASQLVGQRGEVQSIVTDPNADPHTYESSAQDARLFAQADYVMVNGAGYDSWAEKVLAANPRTGRKVLNVADLLGKKEGDNPHFWYQPDYVVRVADQITADLKGVDAAGAKAFDSQRANLTTAMKPYTDRLTAIKSRSAGTPIGSTETIFVYLADYLGLKLLSPPEFMQAVAEGNDPPAPSVAAFLEQITTRAIKVLVYNDQTSTAVTTNIKKLAASKGIKSVAVTETMQPVSSTFENWQADQLDRLQTALGGS